MNLLCRFYDVNEGRVLVDGVDVRQLAANQLRRHIGVVLQEPFLFRGTIWDNLVYGLPTSTPEQAIAAAKAAQAHDFILNSPLGYDTWLGERGAGLSGGERQRLSIARAILYDPPILVLDEATSSVDAESEQAIQQAPEGAHPRPHDDRHRPPPVDAARRPPHLRLRPRPADRARQPRGADCTRTANTRSSCDCSADALDR